MDVRVPVQEFAKRLDRSHHAGHHVVAAEQAANFGLDTGPRARAELAQQLAIESRVQPQAFGDGQHDLPMGDRRANLFRHVDRRQQGPFLVAGRAGAALLAGEGDEHLVVAVRAADAGEALLQVAALQKCLHRAFDDRAPEAILSRKPLVIDLLEGLEMLIQQPPQVGGLGIAGPVQGQRGDTRGGHDRQQPVPDSWLGRSPDGRPPRTVALSELGGHLSGKTYAKPLPDQSQAQKRRPDEM